MGALTSLNPQGLARPVMGLLRNMNFYICVAKNYKVRSALLNSWTLLRVNGSGRVTEFGPLQYDPSCLKHNVKLMALNLFLVW
jgi:hypothetical protein